MGDRGLGPLRQMHRDHVAALDSQPRHRVGKAPAKLAHLAEGVGLDPPLVILIVERRFVAQIGMAIEAIDGDVVVGRDVPSMARAGVGDVFRAVDGLLAKADDAHGGILRCGCRARLLVRLSGALRLMLRAAA